MARLAIILGVVHDRPGGSHTGASRTVPSIWSLPRRHFSISSITRAIIGYAAGSLASILAR